jgi:hypothetical protein
MKHNQLPVTTPYFVDREGRDPLTVMTRCCQYLERVTGWDEDEHVTDGATQLLPLRVLTTTFSHNGKANGPTTLYASRRGLFDTILGMPAAARHHCSYVVAGEPAYTYFDLDAKAEIWGREFVEATESDQPAIVEAVGYFFCQAFARCCTVGGKGAEFPWATMWVFQAHRPGKKMSIHLHHSNPNRGAVSPVTLRPSGLVALSESTPKSPLWPCITVLGHFIKNRMLPLVDEALVSGAAHHGYDHATRICQPDCTGGFRHIVDTAPYSKAQKIKLPLNCKPKGPLMRLDRPPAV